jgi:hypothetical protein
MRSEVEDQSGYRESLERQAPNSEAAHFKQSGQFLGGPNQKPAVCGLQVDSVIANEPCERQ